MLISTCIENASYGPNLSYYAVFALAIVYNEKPHRIITLLIPIINHHISDLQMLKNDWNINLLI